MANSEVERVPFTKLIDTDLCVGFVYDGGPDNFVSSDPLCKIFPCGNQGGIRQVRKDKVTRCVILYSLQNDAETLAEIDENQRRLVFFGDNRIPGRDLFGNRKGGNTILKQAFDDSYALPSQRKCVPPFFVFTRELDFGPRAVRYHGVAVPGLPGTVEDEVLEAKTFNVEPYEYQNYRATFSFLDIQVASRRWLQDLFDANPLSANCPEQWKKWVEFGYANNF